MMVMVLGELRTFLMVIEEKMNVASTAGKVVSSVVKWSTERVRMMRMMMWTEMLMLMMVVLVIVLMKVLMRKIMRMRMMTL